MTTFKDDLIVTDKEFNEFLDAEVATFKKMAEVDHPKELHAQVTVMLRTGLGHKPSYVPFVLADVPETSGERKDMMRAIGRKAWRNRKELGGDPVAVMMTHETWMLKAKNSKDAGAMLPSESPDRIEAVVTSGVTITGKHNMASQLTIRNKEGEMTHLVSDLYAPYERNKKSASADIQNDLVRAFFVGCAQEAREEKLTGDK